MAHDDKAQLNVKIRGRASTYPDKPFCPSCPSLITSSTVILDELQFISTYMFPTDQWNPSAIRRQT